MSNFAGRVCRCLAVLFVLPAVFLATSPASARHWNPTGKALAEDYLEIIDTQQEGRVVVVFWFAPPMMGETIDTATVLDKYVIVGAVIGHMRSSGLVFDPIEALPATNEAGTLLKPVPDDQLSADASGFLFAMKGLMKQSIGAMGEGMRFFVFENGDVHACKKGRLSVPIDGVVYTYDTPIPGCPAK